MSTQIPISAECIFEGVRCFVSVAENRLAFLSGGGDCISRQYVQFTHLCSVRNYLPTVDFCCCATNGGVESEQQQQQRRRRRRQQPNDDDDVNGDRWRWSADADETVDTEDEDNDGESRSSSKRIGDKEKGDAPPIRGAMCCRYHQDWNHFRCLEVDDTVPMDE
jgi:hypothetical protein